MSTESPHQRRTPDGLTRAVYCSRGTARGGPGDPRMTRGRQRPTSYSLLRCPYAQARHGSFLCSHRCSGAFSCTRSRAGRHLRDLSGAGSAPTGSRCDDASSEAAEDVGRRQAGNQPPDEEILGPAQEGTAELAATGRLGRGCTNRHWPARCQPLRARPGPPGAACPSGSPCASPGRRAAPSSTATTSSTSRNGSTPLTSTLSRRPMWRRRVGASVTLLMKKAMSHTPLSTPIRVLRML